MEVTLQAKHPYLTWFVEIAFEKKARPTALLDELANAGWKQNDWRPSGALAIGLGVGGWEIIQLSKPGAGLFGGWSRAELPRFKSEARNIIRKHLSPSDDYSEKRLTLEDLL